MARKSTNTKEVVEEKPVQSNNSLFDYLRFGESYTSLILGIIVVIISTILLLSFVHNKNASKNDEPQLLSQKDIALPSDTVLTTPTENTPTPAPTKTAAEPTVKPAALTPKPTKVVIEPTKAIAKAMPTPAKNPQGSMIAAKGSYTVAAGDTLWSIAEKKYKNGYNWVDIARANNLSNPGVIHSGNVLKLPSIEQKIATKENNSAMKPADSPAMNNTAKITGTNYTVVKNDTLWNIAVRAYGDGYQWVKIARANNLVNPSLIHSGNALKIPRGK